MKEATDQEVAMIRAMEVIRNDVTVGSPIKGEYSELLPGFTAFNIATPTGEMLAVIRSKRIQIGLRLILDSK